MEGLKLKIVSAIREELESRMALARQSYNDAVDSRNNETKSSAGDKYETGREMIQQEIESTLLRMQQLKLFQNELNRLPIEEKSNKAMAGSLVQTTSGLYFLGLSLGKFEVDGAIVYAISTASPLGKLLLNVKEGETITLNNLRQEVIRIV